MEKSSKYNDDDDDHHLLHYYSLMKRMGTLGTTMAFQSHSLNNHDNSSSSTHYMY